VRRITAPDGLELACHEAGRSDGRPALLLHGLSGNASIWADAHPGLAPRFKVVMLDFRGHGDSGRTEDPADFTIEALVSDAVAVLDGYGFERATVLGHGLGGTVAQHLALRHPDRLEALVLVGTGPGPLDPESGWAITRRRIADVMADGGMQAAWDSYLETGFVGWEVEELPDEILDRWRREFMKTAPAAFIGLVRSAGAQTDISGELKGLGCPVLVVVGDDDMAFSEAAEALAELIPGAELLVIPAGGHSPHVSKAEEFNAAVFSFLRRALPRPSRGS
jgi:pimeloyl-ACP methyl ester carboxylesterase